MDFSDIKQGDTIRINIAAHLAPAGFTGKKVEKPAKSMIVRVNIIADVNGQPGRQQAFCTILDDGAGNVYTDRNPLGFIDGPNFSFFSDSRGTGEQAFERV